VGQIGARVITRGAPREKRRVKKNVREGERGPRGRGEGERWGEKRVSKEGNGREICEIL